MRLLAFTTATSRFDVAVLDQGTVVAERAYEGMAHAERMFAAIDEVLPDRSGLDAIACDLGPGSFTGIRVGLAAAKGIALGLGIPLVGVSGLEAMATAARETAPEAAAIVALLDAKRGELFYAVHPGGQPVGHVEAGRAGEVLAAQIRDPAIFFCGAVDHPAIPNDRRIVDEASRSPRAAVIAELSRSRLTETTSLEAVEPIYLRPPDAKPPSRG